MHEILRHLILAHQNHKETYSVLVSKNLPHVEETPRDMGNGLASKGDVCRPIEPITTDI